MLGCEFKSTKKYAKMGIRWEIFNIILSKLKKDWEKKKDSNLKDWISEHIEYVDRIVEMTENQAKEFDKKMEEI
jgi:hypothetical protein